MKKASVFLLKLIVFSFLTALTQVGGILYLISEILIKRSTSFYRLKKIGLFSSTYLITIFLIIPYLAPIFGREKIKNTEYIASHTFFTVLCNRNYVTPILHNTLQSIAIDLHKKHPGIKLTYLDANFPFINKFPLLPHLSHNDGKKIDVSFIYKDKKNALTNSKPSISGYGVFEISKTKISDQTKACKDKGYWQYDYVKYLTFGTWNSSLKFSEKATKDLLLAIVNQKQVGKIFIEPHLRHQLGVQSSKIRFHGCQAVRHDDHIHIQLR